MKTLYLIGILTTTKLVHSYFKIDDYNKEQAHDTSHIEEEETDFNQSVETTKVLGRNSFLYPTDEFGIMEK